MEMVDCVVTVNVNKAGSHFDVWDIAGSGTRKPRHRIPHCSDLDILLHYHQYTSHPNAVETRRFYCQGAYHSHSPDLFQGTVSRPISAPN